MLHTACCTLTYLARQGLWTRMKSGNLLFASKVPFPVHQDGTLSVYREYHARVLGLWLTAMLNRVTVLGWCVL